MFLLIKIYYNCHFNKMSADLYIQSHLHEYDAVIPINQKYLIDTAGQILKSDGNFRNILLNFIKSNPDDAIIQQKYFATQLDIVFHFLNSQPDQRNKYLPRAIFRELTHKNKIVKINIQLYLSFCNNEELNLVVPNLQWSIFGEDLQEIFRFCPLQINNDGTKNIPKIGTKHSRWYNIAKGYNIINDYSSNINFIELSRIVLEIRMLQIYISKSNSVLTKRIIYISSEQSTGILGVDLKIDLSSLNDFDIMHCTSFCKIIQPFIHYKNKGNPHKLSNGIFVYNRNGTLHESLNKICDNELRNIPGIFNKHILFITNKLESFVEGKKYLSDMMLSKDYYIGVMTIDNHTLFWVKYYKILNGRMQTVWYLCDPWGKTISKKYLMLLNEFIQLYNISHWEFLVREYTEQYNTEGSCAIATLSRVVQIGILKNYSNLLREFNTQQIVGENLRSYEQFNKYINEPIQDWSAMLSSCLVRKYI
jgi:hypothetical protein